MKISKKLCKEIIKELRECQILREKELLKHLKETGRYGGVYNKGELKRYEVYVDRIIKLRVELEVLLEEEEENGGEKEDVSVL